MKRFLLIAFLAFAPVVAFAQPVPGTVATPTTTAAPSAPVAQNTVTTTGPVASNTTISFGSLGSQILQWIMVAFGPVIGSMIVWVLVRVLKKLGIDATDKLRARLMDIVVNGLNSGAKQVEDNMQGKGQVEIKNAIVANAVTYTQAHAAETIKALGLDPQSGAAVEAIKAKIETAIADPSAPTPAILDKPEAPAVPKVAA